MKSRCTIIIRDKGTTFVVPHNINMHNDDSWSLCIPRPKSSDAEFVSNQLAFVVHVGFWQLLLMLLGWRMLVVRLSSNTDESIVSFERCVTHA